jgi:hypothetical protein
MVLHGGLKENLVRKGASRTRIRMLKVGAGFAGKQCLQPLDAIIFRLSPDFDLSVS